MALCAQRSAALLLAKVGNRGCEEYVRMATSAQPYPSTQRALSGLIDYAGLFPPAKLAMEPALREYRACRETPYAWMLGRFIVPASRIEELLALLPERQAIELSVIVDAMPAPLHWTATVAGILERIFEISQGRPDVSVSALEVALPPAVSVRDTFDASIGQFAILAENAGLRHVPAYLEMPRGPRWTNLLPGAMDALRRYRFGAKIRCGGVVADAFPSTSEVAAFVRAAGAEGVSWKATAGLHHPVRHLNAPSGFMMHGFLNILAAAVFAQTEASEDVVEAVIAEEDPAAFVFDAEGFSWRELRASIEQIGQARDRAFVAYGSCSFREPVADLTAMSVL